MIKRQPIRIKVNRPCSCCEVENVETNHYELTDEGFWYHCEDCESTQFIMDDSYLGNLRYEDEKKGPDDE